MLVEFVGLPGAGKSTVAHALAQDLRARSRHVAEPTFEIDRSASPRRRMVTKAWHALRFALRRPADAVWSARLVVRSGQTTAADLGLLLLNWCYVLRLGVRGASAPGVYLLDQGCFQALWSVAYRGRRAVDATLPRGADLLRVLQRAPIPEMTVVIVETSRDTVAERLGARTGAVSRLERDVRIADGELKLSRAEAALTAVRALLAEAEAAGVVRVLRVRGDQRQTGGDQRMLLDALAPGCRR